MKSYSDKTPPDSMKAMKPDTTAPEDDGDLDNDDMSDGGQLITAINSCCNKMHQICWSQSCYQFLLMIWLVNH